MTDTTHDDLVKRLRDGCLCNIDSTPCMAEEECRDAYTAADRIEELDQACAKWAEVSQNNYQRAKAAEANLAKAQGALHQIAGKKDYADDPWGIARTTLAELKGQDDGQAPHAG
jgi:hypothetical protein